MALERNMDLIKIVEHLEGDIKTSIVNDIQPCLNLGRNEGGYFGVPRLVLSYVDYLGAFYHGYNGRIDRNTNRRIFTERGYSKAFLNDVFGQIDPNYRKHGKLLWEIYRNGTIHLYSPKIIKDKISNRTIGWILHKLDRSVQLDPPYSFHAEHLVPHYHGDNKWSQPISMKCLYNDLIDAIDRYVSLIQTETSLESNFKQTAEALLEPEETSNLQWW
jgi:hypothetical protein